MMAKRAIYLDERERELARRVFDFAIGEMRERLSSPGGTGVDRMALIWTKGEVNLLSAKFDENEEDGQT